LKGKARKGTIIWDNELLKAELWARTTTWFPRFIEEKLRAKKAKR